MFLFFDDRPSDSPYIERIWTAYSKRADEFLSVAAGHWEMVVTRCRGQAFLTVRGPETRATTVDCPADGEWVGIRFKLGTFLPELLPGALRDRRDVTLPAASSRSFWLNGSAWEYPTFENGTPSRRGQYGRARSDATSQSMRCCTANQESLSLRSSQRHFARATGSHTRRSARSSAHDMRQIFCATAWLLSTSSTPPAISISLTSHGPSSI